MMDSNYRSRKHCLLLYDEDPTHVKAMDYIEKHYEYAKILHDKDCDENGELKKAHYHLIVSFQSAKWRSALSEELGVPENYVQQVNNYEKALEYLIHYNEETKYQYGIDEVTGSLKGKLEKLIANDGLDENDKALDMISFINQYRGELTVSEFASWCASVGKWDIFRRGWGIYLRIIDEHNQLYRRVD